MKAADKEKEGAGAAQISKEEDEINAKFKKGGLKGIIELKLVSFILLYLNTNI